MNILNLATSLADHSSVELHEYFAGDVAERDGHNLSGLPPGASFAATRYAESLFLLLTVAAFSFLQSGKLGLAVIALLIGGLWYFNRTEQTFADVIGPTGDRGRRTGRAALPGLHSQSSVPGQY